MHGPKGAKHTRMNNEHFIFYRTAQNETRPLDLSLRPVTMPSHDVQAFASTAATPTAEEAHFEAVLHLPPLSPYER